MNFRRFRGYAVASLGGIAACQTSTRDGVGVGYPTPVASLAPVPSAATGNPTDAPVVAGAASARLPPRSESAEAESGPEPPGANGARLATGGSHEVEPAQAAPDAGASSRLPYRKTRGRALALQKKGALGEAASLFRRLAADYPLEGAAHGDLGYCLMAMGAKEEARSEFFLAIRHGGPETRRAAYYNLWKLGEVAVSEADFQVPILRGSPSLCPDWGVLAQWNGSHGHGVNWSAASFPVRDGEGQDADEVVISSYLAVPVAHCLEAEDPDDCRRSMKAFEGELETELPATSVIVAIDACSGRVGGVDASKRAFELPATVQGQSR